MSSSASSASPSSFASTQASVTSETTARNTISIPISDLTDQTRDLALDLTTLDSIPEASNCEPEGHGLSTAVEKLIDTHQKNTTGTSSSEVTSKATVFIDNRVEYEVDISDTEYEFDKEVWCHIKSEWLQKKRSGEICVDAEHQAKQTKKGRPEGVKTVEELMVTARSHKIKHKCNYCGFLFSSFQAVEIHVRGRKERSTRSRGFPFCSVRIEQEGLTRGNHHKTPLLNKWHSRITFQEPEESIIASIE